MTKLGDVFRFVIKDLISDGWRTTITIVNLLVFLCSYFALVALAEAAYNFGNQPTDQSALLIISRNVFDPSESMVTDREFLPAEELIPEYVKSVSPLIFKIVNVNGNLIQLRAAKLEDMQTVHSLQLIGGSWPMGESEVVMGEGAATMMNWKIGDTIHVYGNDFIISGLIRAPGTKFSSLWMTLDTAATLFDLKGIYQFGWIQLQSAVDSEAVRSKLQNDPRLFDRFEVYFADNLYQEYTKAVSDMQGVSSLLVILALSAVMLGTYCNIFLILSERSRDITILRAIGVQSGTIRALVTFRTLLQVSIGYILSWGVTSLLLNWFNRINPLTLHSIPLPVSISAKALWIGFILSLCFGWAGIWIPTRHLRNRSIASLMHK
ncbi:MAG: FtsX-like permease family protein [Chloroflexi bacterium]|nr:FtsX-like permease family protein [Chloroflexota bacterium]